ncbi:hypothetical protein BDV39DRAFT_181697 [Aspergillus sergii]|uniref:Uncharacterized protein n=1 Tax=Aspergillus sergii TaxID=1034303 RepID=A0A5N6WT02_9EURO|nr:hypothetical protein BDV39DRAFT_181697 [Aspergillus sergii]
MSQTLVVQSGIIPLNGVFYYPEPFLYMFPLVYLYATGKSLMKNPHRDVDSL